MTWMTYSQLVPAVWARSSAEGGRYDIARADGDDYFVSRDWDSLAERLGRGPFFFRTIARCGGLQLAGALDTAILTDVPPLFYIAAVHASGVRSLLAL